MADHVIDWKDERRMWAEFEKSLARKSPGRLKSSFVVKSVAICVVLAVALLAGGCGLRTLRKDIEQVAEQAVLEGHARVRGTEGNPIVIVVYSLTAQGRGVLARGCTLVGRYGAGQLLSHPAI